MTERPSCAAENRTAVPPAECRYLHSLADCPNGNGQEQDDSVCRECVNYDAYKTLQFDYYDRFDWWRR